jgi:RNA polymerase sigma-54 factor
MVTEKERYAMADVSLQLQLKPKITQLQTLTIKLLTLHSQDLVEYLQEQVTENPLLDIRYHDVSSSGSGAAEKPIDNIRSHEDSLEDMLMKQLRVLTLGNVFSWQPPSSSSLSTIRDSFAVISTN